MEKITKRSRQKKASTLPAGSYLPPGRRLFCASHIEKAKPPFPPSLSRFCQPRAFFFNPDSLLFIFQSAEQLQPKSGKTIVASAMGRALANFAEVRGSAKIVGQSIAALGFDRFAGERPCAPACAAGGVKKPFC